MTEITDLLDVVMKYGISGLLAIVVVLIVQKPERAEHLKALLFFPMYRAFRWGTKQYVAARVGSTATEFVNAELVSTLPSLQEVTIRVKWVSSESDAVLATDGTVVLRMRDTDDQTRNILMATQLALPHIICSTMRGNLSEELAVSIDLTLLHRLADRMGKRARPLFQRCFLAPETQKAPGVKELFERLVMLDSSGLFTVVFLEELAALGEDLYAAGDLRDRSENVLSLLEFLLTIVQREEGEHVPLDYGSTDFSLGVILLAESRKAEIKGVSPYVHHVDKSIRRGAESIYILSYPQASDFMTRVVTALDGDDRLTLVDRCEVRRRSRHRERGGFGEIAVFQTNRVFVDNAFESRLEVSGITDGAFVQGSVVDVARDVVLVDVNGMNGLLSRFDSSWHYVDDCHRILAVGNRRTFLVASVNRDRKQLRVSLRLPDQDPWSKQVVPDPGASVDITIVSAHNSFFAAVIGENIEARVPRNEIAWIDSQTPSDEDLLGSKQSAVVLDRDESRRCLECSIKRAQPNPWQKIHEMLPIGTRLRAVVREVRDDSVIVDIPDSLQGVIPGEALRKAGHEYADFTATLVTGQGLDVVVSKVFIARQRIRLDLARNEK